MQLNKIKDCVVVPGVVARKPIGPALNFTNATLSSDISAPVSLKFTCVTVQNINTMTLAFLLF